MQRMDMQTWGKRERGRIGRLGLPYRLYVCKIDSYWEASIKHRNLSLVLFISSKSAKHPGYLQHCSEEG